MDNLVEEIQLFLEQERLAEEMDREIDEQLKIYPLFDLDGNPLKVDWERAGELFEGGLGGSSIS